MSEHFFAIAILIAFLSLGIASLTFFLNLRQSKTQRLSSESQFIGDIQKQLHDPEVDVNNLETQKACLDFVWDYLNIIDRLCYFIINNRLQDDIVNFFTNYLKLGLRFYDWLIEIEFTDNAKMENSFPYIQKAREKLSLTPDKREIHFINDYHNFPPT